MTASQWFVLWLSMCMQVYGVILCRRTTRRCRWTRSRPRASSPATRWSRNNTIKNINHVFKQLVQFYNKISSILEGGQRVKLDGRISPTLSVSLFQHVNFLAPHQKLNISCAGKKFWRLRNKKIVSVTSVLKS